MCKCDPNVRTPFCGKAGCEPPRAYEKMEPPDGMRELMSELLTTIRAKLPKIATGVTLFVTHEMAGVPAGVVSYISNLSRPDMVRELRAWLNSEPHNEQEKLLEEVRDRLAKVVARWGTFASAHEGLGVLFEEVRELEAEVFKKQESRDINRLRSEGLDVAIVGLKIALMVDAGMGRK